MVDIDIGLKGRNKELCKPTIQLFYNTEVQGEVEMALQRFIDLKDERKKSDSIEAVRSLSTVFLSMEMKCLLDYYGIP